MFSSGAMSQGITVCGNEIELNNPGQDLVHVKDRSGKAYSLQRYDGVYYNTFYNVAHLQQIKGFKLRADDVYFAGYLRTGTHWTYEMMSMLLKADVNGYFDHMKKAENFLQQHPDIPVLTVVYEEMLENKLMAVERLAGFLGVQKNVGLFEAVAEKCQFSKMVVDKSAYTIKFSGENSIFRKGVSGDWKNWFTDEMLEDYIRVYNEEMSGSRFYRKEYVRQK
ncbi:flavonol sulfotransferase-like isoform X2 [Haliotis rufescens]|uniref:flavonol sulfotransferase-like isoform X2 n=1 Tax=Haliotis rufescens TaxID=6454 RepID=UPI00201F9AD2|nr:flavonol sulfotransferase-like isoform X2 [Haliotis rufescens]